uniref:Uncharacterized protein n=1 Tax=Anguilla anguilla TaxID=7936 RepID=A0A0E9RXN0_ANGAN
MGTGNKRATPLQNFSTSVCQPQEGGRRRHKGVGENNFSEIICPRNATAERG